MHEVYVSFAAFLFFIKNTGLKITVHDGQSKRFLTFHYGKETGHLFQVMPGKRGYDCGYVIINIHDYGKLFSGDTKFVDLATNETIDLKDYERPYKKLSDGTRGHCNLPEKLWRNIPIIINSNEIVNCVRKY
jgi:hypothetical protein